MKTYHVQVVDQDNKIRLDDQFVPSELKTDCDPQSDDTTQIAHLTDWLFEQDLIRECLLDIELNHKEFKSITITRI